MWKSNQKTDKVYPQFNEVYHQQILLKQEKTNNMLLHTSCECSVFAWYGVKKLILMTTLTTLLCSFS